MRWGRLTRRGVVCLAAAGCIACGDQGRDGRQTVADAPADSAALARPAPMPEPMLVADAGFAAPESMLHDEAADLYLVSNVNGPPAEHDDNGFISRVSPDGQVVALKWIDGAASGVTLHAPKGMALRGDTLFVSDIDAVRLFRRATGEPIGQWPVAGAAFLNDLAMGPDGVLYASDTGILPEGRGMREVGTDAVYRFDATGRPGVMADGAALQNPNGLYADAEGVLVVTRKASRILRVAADSPSVVAELPGGQLDGIERLRDGTSLVSSWQTSAVYQVDASGAATALVEDVTSPADIGLDRRRNRLLIPQLTENRLWIQPLPEGTAASPRPAPRPAPAGTSSQPAPER